jgi:FKBP-type peptidyl-prolyl cis-trans isomerase (trigger factor)
VDEIDRELARRVYRVHASEQHIRKLTGERLAEMARTIRLPGFRPGKIPPAVLEARYGAKARAEVLRHIASEAGARVLSRGELASSLELVRGADSGEMEFRLAVTHLPELAPVDFAKLKFERLAASPAELQAADLTSDAARDLFDRHLRQQVLDSLNAAYPFPLAPALVEREYEAIQQAAAEALASDSSTKGEREAMASELRGIAERRVRLGAVIVEMARRYEIRVTGAEVESRHWHGETPAQASQRIMEDTVIAWFLAHSNVTEREVSAGELRDLVEAEG